MVQILAGLPFRSNPSVLQSKFICVFNCDICWSLLTDLILFKMKDFSDIVKLLISVTQIYYLIRYIQIHWDY